MNKFQKIATQMAKDDVKKDNGFGFRELKNVYYNRFKKDKYPILKALEYKNWNKTLEF